MPVKIRCTGCQKSLNVPDAARGKVVKCPACETKIRVPAEEDADEAVEAAPRKAAAGAKPAARKPAPKRPKSEEDFLSDLDLNRMEDTSTRVCPKCGAETDLEAEACPKCGIDFATGQLTAQAARRKGKRGPDPREFYAAAWKDSWQFLMKNKKLAFRTGMYWTLFGVLSLNTLFMAAWCSTAPPKLFWLALSFLFAAGAGGWYWFLNNRIIESTMAREKKLKDVKFDLILNAGLGVKSLIWPWGLTFPLILFPLTMTAGYVAVASSAVVQAAEAKEKDQIDKKVKPKDRKPLTDEEVREAVAAANPALGIAFLAWMIVAAPVGLASLTFPVSQVHLTARYPWTAWSLWNMLRSSFKNFLPVAYWWLMALAVYLPFVVVWVVLSILRANSDSFSNEEIAKFMIEQARWILEKTGYSYDDMGIVAYLILWSVIVVMTAVTLAPFCFLMAFPSVYMMRANGLFGYYNRENLELESTKKANVPAGFWPRWVAGIADLVILSGVAFVIVFLANIMDLVIARLGLDFYYELFGIRLYGFFLLGLVALCVITMLYFATSESGFAQGTPGMRGIGLIVTDMEGKKISKGKGFSRFFGRLVALYFTGSIGFLMAAFTEKKQALHDSMTKTLVVWKGDDEATEH